MKRVRPPQRSCTTRSRLRGLNSSSVRRLSFFTKASCGISRAARNRASSLRMTGTIEEISRTLGYVEEWVTETSSSRDPAGHAIRSGPDRGLVTPGGMACTGPKPSACLPVARYRSHYLLSTLISPLRSSLADFASSARSRPFRRSSSARSSSEMWCSRARFSSTRPSVMRF